MRYDTEVIFTHPTLKMTTKQSNMVAYPETTAIDDLSA